MTDQTNASATDNTWSEAGMPLDNRGSAGSPSPRTGVDIEMVQDVPLTVQLEVGRTKITIRNLLQLNQGSVVELDREQGEPMDLYVNGTLFAHGEVVLVNDKFGVRITDVVSPQERVKKLS